jgi:hypothetical protein
MADNRKDRELETRERTVRKKAWTRPEVLPSPNPEPGYDFHWELNLRSFRWLILLLADLMVWFR